MMTPVPVGQNCLWAPLTRQVVLGLRVSPGPIRPEIPLMMDGKLRLQDLAVGSTQERTAVRTVQCFDFSVKSTGTGRGSAQQYLAGAARLPLVSVHRARFHKIDAPNLPLSHNAIQSI